MHMCMSSLASEWSVVFCLYNATINQSIDYINSSSSTNQCMAISNTIFLPSGLPHLCTKEMKTVEETR